MHPVIGLDEAVESWIARRERETELGGSGGKGTQERKVWRDGREFVVTMLLHETRGFLQGICCPGVDGTWNSGKGGGGRPRLSGWKGRPTGWQGGTMSLEKCC